MDADWQIHPEGCSRIVNKIIESLMKHLPVSVPPQEGLIDLRKMAPAGSSSKGKKDKKLRCHFCKKGGHFKKDCLKKKKWFEKKGIAYDPTHKRTQNTWE